MNKKIIKSIASITCGLGITLSIPFVSTSCKNLKKIGENWICSVSDNILYQYRSIDSSDTEWKESEEKTFYFGEHTFDKEYRKLFSLKSQNGLNVSFSDICFHVKMQLPEQFDIPGGTFDFTTNDIWLINEPSAATDPFLGFDISLSQATKSLDIGLSNYPKFSQLLSSWSGSVYEGKQYVYLAGTNIVLTVGLEICDENGYWHTIVSDKNTQEPLLLDYTFKIF